MNLLSARVVLRQRSLADTLDLAVPFCLANKRPLAVLSAVMLVPIAGLLAYLRIVRHWHWPALWLLCVGASLFVEGVFTVALGELMFKPPAQTRTRSFLARYLRRLPALVFAIVVREVMVVATLLILAPGSLFVSEAMLLEGAPFGRALARSRALARNRGGSCFAIWLVRLCLPALGAVSLDLLLNSLCGYVLQLGRPTGDLFSDGGSGFAVLGALLAVPLGAAMRFLGYIDLRTRKEGWDIQLRFVALVEQSALGRRRAA
jgi:hypothetical protein